MSDERGDAGKQLKGEQGNEFFENDTVSHIPSPTSLYTHIHVIISNNSRCFLLLRHELHKATHRFRVPLKCTSALSQTMYIAVILLNNAVLITQFSHPSSSLWWGSPVSARVSFPIFFFCFFSLSFSDISNLLFEDKLSSPGNIIYTFLVLFRGSRKFSESKTKCTLKKLYTKNRRRKKKKLPNATVKHGAFYISIWTFKTSKNCKSKNLGKTEERLK